jgi:hypothetical protein
MPGSRASSPGAGDGSSTETDGASMTSANDRCESDTNKGNVCPSVQYHPGLTIPNPGSPPHITDSGTARKKFKYVKPRLGNNFQAKIEAFQPKRKQDDSQDLNFLDVSTAASAPPNPAPKKKRAGRPPKAGRAKQQGELICNT